MAFFCEFHVLIVSTDWTVDNVFPANLSCGGGNAKLLQNMNSRNMQVFVLQLELMIGDGLLLWSG